MVEKYVSRYAEKTVNKLDKKAILEGTKNRLNAIKITLKKFKEDEAKELTQIANELDSIISDAVENLGASNPVVSDLVDASKDVEINTNISEIKPE